MAELKRFLEEKEKEGLLRTLKPLSARGNGLITLKDKEYLDFSSNDYLGLSGHPALREAAIKAIERYGCGSCGSRLMTGDLALHHELEEKVARFKGKDAALVLNSGYQANVGIIPALYGKGDVIFCDRLAHASIIDGILLSGARFFRFRHNDAEHLASLLKDNRKEFKNGLIVTETVFSMDGDEPPLAELVRLKDEHDCRLLVDEAHATGIYGNTGSGIAERDGLTGRVDFLMGTFSKGLGGFGAYLAASREAIDFLVNTCRSFIYSTALPPAVIATGLSALEIVEKEPWRRRDLLEAVSYFRGCLKQRRIEAKGTSQIVPVVTGGNFKTLEAARALQAKGYWVSGIRPPTVPEGEGRLRFSLTVYHKKDILQKLADDIAAVGV